MTAVVLEATRHELAEPHVVTADRHVDRVGDRTARSDARELRRLQIGHREVIADRSAVRAAHQVLGGRARTCKRLEPQIERGAEVGAQDVGRSLDAADPGSMATTRLALTGPVERRVPHFTPAGEVAVGVVLAGDLGRAFARAIRVTETKNIEALHTRGRRALERARREGRRRRPAAKTAGQANAVGVDQDA
jgi:hypothetical protein